jgi:hypothetical protein
MSHVGGFAPPFCILHSAFCILHSAFAAALAKEKKAELVTGDPEFRALEKEILVVWLK